MCIISPCIRISRSTLYSHFRKLEKIKKSFFYHFVRSFSLTAPSNTRRRWFSQFYTTAKPSTLKNSHCRVSSRLKIRETPPNDGRNKRGAGVTQKILFNHPPTPTLDFWSSERESTLHGTKTLKPQVQSDAKCSNLSLFLGFSFFFLFLQPPKA